jgi:hypothetical protein
MLISLLTPYLPPTVVAVNQPSTVAQQTTATRKPDMTFKAKCELKQTSDKPTWDWTASTFNPLDAIESYYDKQKINMDFSNARYFVEKAPNHGKITNLTDAERKEMSGYMSPDGQFKYISQTGYRGADSVVFLVENKGKLYKVHISFYVVEQTNDQDWYEQNPSATRCVEDNFRRIGEADALMPLYGMAVRRVRITHRY